MNKGEEKKTGGVTEGVEKNFVCGQSRAGYSESEYM